MDAVELPLPAAIVTKIMRSSGCSGGGGVTRVELLGSQSERETCSSSFHPEKDDNCNANGSRPAFWNKISDEDMYRSASQMSSHHSQEQFIDHDMASVPEAKQSQRKSGKSSRSNGSSSKRSRAALMEASMNLSGVIDTNDLQKEHVSYPGKYNISAKQKASVSGKRSDKRNGKVHKSKCESFSVKAGLSSFSSSAGGNNILGVYGSKQDICDFAKNVDEVSLNELLDGSYKCPDSTKEKEKKTEILNGSILVSVREACSILQLQKTSQTSQTLNVAPLDANYNNNASSFLPNAAISGVNTNNDNKGDIGDPFSVNKVGDSCSGFTDHTNILHFPLFPPKDVLNRLSLLPPKDLDLMLLDSMKPTSTSKVQNGGSLPTFPWSHISGGHFKSNPDVVKSTASKTSCQGRWAKMGNTSTATPSSSKDTTTFLKDFHCLTYNQNLVPLGRQWPGPTTTTTDNQISQLPLTTAPAGHSAGVLSAAQTLCDMAARFRSENGSARWQKKSVRPTKLVSDEKLEKALFAIPSSRHIVGPTQKKPRVSSSSNDPTKAQFHWATGTPQSSRSSPGKVFKEPKHHHQSSSPMKRSITNTSTTTPPGRLMNKPPSKLRKLVPMEWKSRVMGDQKGNGK